MTRSPLSPLRHVLPRLGSVLADCFERNRGARIGESAVVSKRLHAFNPRTPEVLQVVTDADAGQVFYHRPRGREVIHLDVFHQVAELDHRALAGALIRAVEQFRLDFPDLAISYNPCDYMDIQTARGGGRVTGNLTFGQKISLRRAHLNHVHLAAMLPDDWLPLLFYLVAAIEEEIRAQGQEIRKIQKLSHLPGGAKGQRSDLSPYAANYDTLLRGNSPLGESSVRWQGSSDPGEQLQMVASLAEEFGSLQDLGEVLEELAAEPTHARFQAQLARREGNSEALWRSLEEKGLIARQEKRVALSEAGWKLRHYLRVYRREIEMYLRRLLRKMPLPERVGRYRNANSSRPRSGSPGPVVDVVPVGAEEWLGDLALPETVIAAARRAFLNHTPFRLERGDLHLYRRLQRLPLEICLVIDASASMAGARIKAAKFLAQHLVLSTRDRVAVLVFQEHQCNVHVPFTRSFNRVQEGLRQIRSYGLTPLALALLETLDYLKASRARNALLLVITDGIPTVPKWSINPLEDALEAAAMVAERKIRFGCIGLEPNHRYLKELVQRGRGTLYVVEELDKNVLATIAHRERRRVRDK